MSENSRRHWSDSEGVSDPSALSKNSAAVSSLEFSICLVALLGVVDGLSSVLLIVLKAKLGMNSSSNASYNFTCTWLGLLDYFVQKFLFESFSNSKALGVSLNVTLLDAHVKLSIDSSSSADMNSNLV